MRKMRETGGKEEKEDEWGALKKEESKNGEESTLTRGKRVCYSPKRGREKVWAKRRRVKKGKKVDSGAHVGQLCLQKGGEGDTKTEVRGVGTGRLG